MSALFLSRGIEKRGKQLKITAGDYFIRLLPIYLLITDLKKVSRTCRTEIEICLISQSLKGRPGLRPRCCFVLDAT